MERLLLIYMKIDKKRPKIVGVVALIIQKNKILCVKRLGLEGKGSLSLPGGRLEEGEDLKEGLLREIKEETGYSITLLAGRPCFSGKISYEGKPAIFYIYEADISGGVEKIQKEEVEKLIWVSGKDYIGSLRENKFLVGVINDLEKLMIDKGLYE